MSSETEAENLLDKQKREINIIDRFEKLRPRPFSYVYKLIPIVLVVGFFESYYGPTTVTLTILVVVIYSSTAYESEKINKRIDLLMKYVSGKDKNA